MNQRTIPEIKALLKATDELNEELLQSLQQDKRKGVQKLLASYEKKRLKYEQLNVRYDEMCWYENTNTELGRQLIAGVDEAGRGPLAGPVVAAAVILPKDFRLPGLNDSKQLNAANRQHFYDIITHHAVGFEIAVIHNNVIDEINIHEATKRAMFQAIEQLQPIPDHVLIDAVPLYGLHCSSQSINKGDCKSVSIAAASVLAKVTRDRIMQQVHSDYPEYQFNTNMGYGTKYHLDMLGQIGATPYHRQSFSPVRQAVFPQ